MAMRVDEPGGGGAYQRRRIIGASSDWTALQTDGATTIYLPGRYLAVQWGGGQSYWDEATRKWTATILGHTIDVWAGQIMAYDRDAGKYIQLGSSPFVYWEDDRIYLNALDVERLWGLKSEAVRLDYRTDGIRITPPGVSSGNPNQPGNPGGITPPPPPPKEETPVYGPPYTPGKEKGLDTTTMGIAAAVAVIAFSLTKGGR